MNSNSLVKMGSRSIVYVGLYALIYQHTILGERIVSRDELPRGVLPSGILKIEKYCPGLKVRFPIIAHNRQCISGTYRAKGVFVGRIIYEKTVEDYNKMWWSMRFEPENNRWIFEYSSSKIVMGELKFGGIIENFSDEPGEYIVKYNLSNFISFYYRRLQTKRESYPTTQEQDSSRTRLLI